jgi:hypothetical protein
MGSLMVNKSDAGKLLGFAIGSILSRLNVLMNILALMAAIW